VRRGWASPASCRSWPAARRTALIVRPLIKLGFINFAHWSLVDRVPAAGSRRSSRRLRQPYLVFQSNFNGDPALYIDAFSLVVRGRLWLMWAGAYRYPSARPMERFRKFILERAIPDDRYHYWAAYPEGSSRMVVSALALRRSFDDFAREAAALPPERFAEAYERFLTDVQEHL
jgi:hypothetical protein